MLTSRETCSLFVIANAARDGGDKAYFRLVGQAFWCCKNAELTAVWVLAIAGALFLCA